MHDDVLDAGPRGSGHGTERLCAATNAIKPIDEMIRFVVAPDGSVVPDLKRRLPGRGIWITATEQALRRAIARQAFARGFKRDVCVAAELVEATERLLQQAALDALAMAHKAGQVGIGFARASLALARDRVAGLLNAADGAPDGARKLIAARHRREDRSEIAVIDIFSSVQLGLALGRPNVIHAALLAGPESTTFLVRAARLDGFRTGPISGLSGVGKHQIRKSAKADARTGRRSAEARLRGDGRMDGGKTAENRQSDQESDRNRNG